MDRPNAVGLLRREIAYGPLASQADFHESTATFKGFSGPVGWGKSQALCQEAIKLAYLNAGRTGLIGAPTYPMLRCYSGGFVRNSGEERYPLRLQQE